MIFEDILLPSLIRWDYACANICSDIGRFTLEGMNRTMQPFLDIYTLVTPVKDFTTGARIASLNLMLPIGCNARCPNICFTDIENWRRQPEHLKLHEIISILEEFKNLGGEVVRIIGDGEPFLYRELPTICQWIRENGLNLILFSNGIWNQPFLASRILTEYEKGNLYIYIKLWSEDVEVQNKMVAPRIPYNYCDGDVGLAPDNFYDVWDIDSKRVGFQVLVTTRNYNDVKKIISGPKINVPLFIDEFVATGAGENHSELFAVLPEATRPCSMPPRASYTAVVNSKGELQPGIFVPEQAVSIKGGKLKDIWLEIFVKNPLFWEARYGSNQGCFCAKIRNSSKPAST